VWAIIVIIVISAFRRCRVSSSAAAEAIVFSFVDAVSIVRKEDCNKRRRL
jgi:hypothetical protein